MKILYLDTSSSFLYCGLINNEELVFGIKNKYEKDLSQHTLESINNKFIENKISPESVDKIIVVNGPGSFTGIRIGITIAKVYGWALNIPVITISSLYSMAVSIETNRIKVPIIDARRGYVYGAVYDSNNKNIIKEQYIKLSSLIKQLSELNMDYDFISNDNFDFDTLKYNPNILKTVGLCKDNKPTVIHDVNPVYLKKTEAEEKNDKTN